MCVKPDLNTLQTTLLDDVVRRLGLFPGPDPGNKPALSGAELLCLAAARHLLAFSSERKPGRVSVAFIHSGDVVTRAQRTNTVLTGRLHTWFVARQDRWTRCCREGTNALLTSPMPTLRRTWQVVFGSIGLYMPVA